MSAGGKTRSHGVKREHALIPGLSGALEPIAALPCVSVCIPGRIRRTRARPGPFLTAQADTPDGLKLAAHGKGNVQEVFVITSDRDMVRAALRGS
jgi:hypothetical protein